jgi:hypothetical protein
MNNSKKLTKAITAKFADGDFQRLKTASERDGKCPAEWCRQRLLEVLHGTPTSGPDQALMAEIAATQDIVVGLICALGREGRLSSQKAQEIVDAAHERKYRDVVALFKYAESKSRKAS